MMNHNDFQDGYTMDEIIYRGEGNSSIVVALKNQAKVIRLLKKDGKIMKSSQDNHSTQHPMSSIKFIHHIMKPLTEPFLSGTMELIHLKSNFINLLSEKLEDHRPAHRLNKTLSLDDQYALVMDDLCALPKVLTSKIHPGDFYGSTISVEIKPKQGFLPIHKMIMKSSTNDQFITKIATSCLYGSTQKLKLARGRITSCSDYCPINLFSGCPIKMKNALECLLMNPQNNLRIFKDLVLVYGENCQYKLKSTLRNFFEIGETKSAKNGYTDCYEERLISLLIQCLLNQHDSDNNSIDIVESYESSHLSDTCSQHSLKIRCKRCDIHPSIKKHRSENGPIGHKLPQTSVLTNILRAQKLDTIGAHEALFMLEWLMNHENHGESIDIFEELSRPQMPRGFGTSLQLPGENRQQYYFRKVWEFLVSLTAKDCSIIVTLRQISRRCYESIDRDYRDLRGCLLRESKFDNFYLYHVGIADLDQKMPLKIPRICDNLNLILQMREQQNKDNVSKVVLNSV